MVVGEAWGYEEEKQGLPFVGQSGQELDRMFNEAGITAADLLFTNVINARPENNEAWRFFLPAGAITQELNKLHPGPLVYTNLARLYEQIDVMKPKLIIAVGNYALWALTGHSDYSIAKDKAGKSTGIRAPSGIMRWRGSQTWLKIPHNSFYRFTSIRPTPVLPIIHPASILRQWDQRAITVHDLKERVPKVRAGMIGWEKPPRTYLAPPDFDQAKKFLQSILNRAANTTLGPLRLAVDIETLSPMLVCVGFAPSTTLAMSLPFVKITNAGTKDPVQFDSYWPRWQEKIFITLIRTILTHPNIDIVGQNFAYDTQYLEEEFGVIPRLRYDTMLMHHLLFPGTTKGLDMLSSLYCDHHVYWKDDGKDWHLNDDLASQLVYNCDDCVKTLEIANTLIEVIEAQGLTPQWEETLKRYQLSTSMTRRGVLIDKKARQSMLLSVLQQKATIESWLAARFPQTSVSDSTKTPWYDSPTQMMELFYSKEKGLGLSPVTDRHTGRPSTGKEAVEELRHRYPSLMRIFDAIQALRSLGVFHRNFLAKAIDPDGRMRCSYNPAGTETFRFNSYENAFGRGTNLQNIPSGNED